MYINVFAYLLYSELVLDLLHFWQFQLGSTYSLVKAERWFKRLFWKMPIYWLILNW